MQTIEKSKAVVIERPGEVSFRDIRLTTPRNDAQIARLVVDVKCILEKIREQIQNLE